MTTLHTHAIVAIAGLLMGAFLVFMLLERRRRQSRDDRQAAEQMTREFRQGRERLARELQELDRERAALNAHKVSLEEYQQENSALKRDLQNLDVNVRKIRLDELERLSREQQVEARVNELAERYLADVEKWVAASITANNYAATKQRLQRVIDWCRDAGFTVSADREQELLRKLKEDFESEVRRAVQREEQARIKAQIREEQAREREIQRALDAAERERQIVEAALARALAAAGAAHSAEVDALRARLADAEATKRAISQAQLTKAGHLYVISNIGSFGEGVLKLGMTRRLEPMDRIAELGDASVPFPFDVHMMISCDDAPAMEAALHREFHKHRVNKVNPRKEYFRVTLDEVRRFVEARHGQVDFVADAEAIEYRQSVSMSEADQEYIEGVFEKADEQLGAADVED